jgi:hypothetical protein
MTTDPLLLSPAFSTANLSEISDFELVDQDRDAWSSNDAESESDAEERTSLLSRDNHLSLGQHTDHATDAWNSMHLVNRSNSDEIINERNELVAERVGHDTETIDSFASGGNDIERAEESPDRTLTDIDTSHPSMTSVKELEEATPSRPTSCTVSEVDQTQSASGSSYIKLLFPDPIEGSVISLPGPPVDPYEVQSRSEIEEDTDVPSSAHFTSVSSIYSLSANNSELSFNIPAEIVDGTVVEANHEQEQAHTVVHLLQEAEQPDGLHLMAGGLLPLPAGPSREPSTEIVRVVLEKDSSIEGQVHKNNEKGPNKDARRFDNYVSKRNL